MTTTTVLLPLPKSDMTYSITDVPLVQRYKQIYTQIRKLSKTVNLHECFLWNFPIVEFLTQVAIPYRGIPTGATNGFIPPGATNGFIPPKLPKLDLITDAKYVANVVNVDMWL